MDPIVFEFLARPFWGFTLILGVLLGTAVVFAALPKIDSKKTPFEKLQNDVGLAMLPTPLFAIGVLLWCTLTALLLIGLLAQIWEIITATTPSSDTKFEWRFAMVRLTALTATFAAVIAFPFTVARLALMAKQTTTAEQGLITDRLNKAVEGLGVDKQVNRLGRDRSYIVDSKATRDFEWKDSPTPLPSAALDQQQTQWQNYPVDHPNVEIRIGSVYALERIAQDSLRDHLQVMEILCAYIRNNCDSPDNKTRPDVTAALEVLGRRSSDRIQHENSLGFRLQLQKCNFRLLQISEANFSNANFSETSWLGCEIRNNIFTNANLTNNNFDEGKLEDLNFASADLAGSKMKVTEIWRVNFMSASLRGLHFQDTNFYGGSFEKVALYGAYFEKSDLNQLSFSGSEIENLTLQETNMYSCDFSGLQLKSLNLDNRSEFQNCNFRGVGLRSCNMENYSGIVSDFDGAYIHTNCKVSGPIEHSTSDGDGNFYTDWRAFQKANGFDPDNPN